MKEIGSEYWQIDTKKEKNKLEFLKIGKDRKLLMSGTTAIDYVLKEVKDEIKIVYMPDYCCESMIIPFIDNNYKIKYYNVDLINNQYDINIKENCSIFFAMSYFGYNCSNMDYYIQKFNNRKIVVIEDITHRMFCKNNYCKYSNYLICSLRKWLPIYTGGIAINLNQTFRTDTSKFYIDNELIAKKKKAMLLKKDYIEGKKVKKETYLELFRESNELIEQYKEKGIDNESIKILKSIDLKQMIDNRRNNVKTIEHILENKKIRVLYKLAEGDCPLFVPIILKNRDYFRKEFINNNIYCPVHWPNYNGFNNEIYNTELSLICDQRYNTEQIKEYINLLIKIVEGN